VPEGRDRCHGAARAGEKLCECTIEELQTIEQHLAEQLIDATPAVDIPST
jgi:hypothetical protein